MSWYRDLSVLTPAILALFQKELDRPQNIVSALSVFKCGLFSHDLPLVKECGAFLNHLWT
jgi:hypothetical protein